MIERLPVHVWTACPDKLIQLIFLVQESFDHHIFVCMLRSICVEQGAHVPDAVSTILVSEHLPLCDESLSIALQVLGRESEV
jgi:hypothetical protein